MFVIDSGYCKLKVREDTGPRALGALPKLTQLWGWEIRPWASALQQGMCVGVVVFKRQTFIEC